MLLQICIPNAHLSKSGDPMGDSVRVFQKLFRGKTERGYVVHARDGRIPLGPGVTALPLREL